MVENPSISMPEPLVSEIDERRESDEQSEAYTSRSEWVREAVKARFAAEDRDEWSPPEADENRPAAEA